MEFPLTPKQIIEFSRKSELKIKAAKLESQIELLVELDLEDSHEEKINELIADLKGTEAQLKNLPSSNIGEIIDTSEYGINAFNWPVNQTTMMFHALSALSDGGIISPAAKETLGATQPSPPYYDNCEK